MSEKITALDFLVLPWMDLSKVLFRDFFFGSVAGILEFPGTSSLLEFLERPSSNNEISYVAALAPSAGQSGSKKISGLTFLAARSSLSESEPVGGPL